jgi:TIR domain-containing protein
VEASGDRYLRDVRDLRSGEEWEPRLLEMIEHADIFQLFWSSNSMRSRFVRREWEHALGLGRPDFIRPTYWENPFPESPADGLPPEALRALNFHRMAADLVASRPDEAPASTPRSSAQVISHLSIVTCNE